jgi:hypothetical protein
MYEVLKINSFFPIAMYFTNKRTTENEIIN